MSDLSYLRSFRGMKYNEMRKRERWEKGGGREREKERKRSKEERTKEKEE